MDKYTKLSFYAAKFVALHKVTRIQRGDQRMRAIIIFLTSNDKQLTFARPSGCVYVWLRKYIN